MSKARSYCFTLNNWTIQERDEIKEWTIKYLCFGEEGLGAGKTPHLQGFVTWRSPRSFGATRRMAPRAHWEVAAGNSLHSQRYCSKEQNNFFEKGDIPRPGKRNDLEGVRDRLEAGDGIGDIVRSGVGAAAVRYAESVAKYLEPGRTWEPTVYWLWGPTGVGKTRVCWDLWPNLWCSGSNSKWWDGYDAHETVLLDDVRRKERGEVGGYAYADLLRILDGYPYRIEVKNGFRQLLAKTMIITCPYKPEVMYAGCGEDVDQLLRRIDYVFEVKKEN